MLSRKLYSSIRSLAIGCFVLMFALSAAWAATYYKSKVVRANGGSIPINSDAKVHIPDGALSSYLNDQGVDSVQVTVELIEGDNGELTFVFGPTGAYFDTPVELRLKGDYVDADQILLDENGEALEYTVSKNGDQATFYIPHFSEYSYDDYDYY